MIGAAFVVHLLASLISRLSSLMGPCPGGVCISERPCPTQSSLQLTLQRACISEDKHTRNTGSITLLAIAASPA